ncbi:short-subunit dehydrogenase [Kitasatospora atroaurantiaca]|uniref:Short-subunit dehydrogenase n=1 Tax=Kitasatospora atroaurantiaca TaxID=285545 RepID=A0A561EL30_9ACTN|nr:short-subunit dehydrogenase [Kitasatospora atroaurantiaca]
MGEVNEGLSGTPAGSSSGSGRAVLGTPGPAARITTELPVALVTGASSGIGRATALRLAALGWYPLLSGTDPERLTEIARLTGGHAMAGDLCRPDGPDRLASWAQAATGRVDVLIANAGVGWRGPFAGMPPDVLERMITLNLIAPLQLARLLLPGMTARGSGRIVLVGSIAGAVGVGEEAVYTATKAALGMFAESLRYELRGTGVRVSVVLPGVVDTPFFRRRGSPYDRAWPRAVTPERVADTIVAGITGRRDRLFVPWWLRVPERVHGVAPGLFERLAARFG